MWKDASRVEGAVFLLDPSSLSTDLSRRPNRQSISPALDEILDHEDRDRAAAPIEPPRIDPLALRGMRSSPVIDIYDSHSGPAEGRRPPRSLRSSENDPPSFFDLSSIHFIRTEHRN